MAARKKRVLTPEEQLEAALVPESEWPYEVPENWCWVRIGSVNSYKSSSVDPSKTPDRFFELYSVPSLEEDYPEIIAGSEIGSTKQSVQKDDVLLCKINPRINRVWKVTKYTDETLIASSEWVVIRSAVYEPNFLMRCLSAHFFREQLLSHVSGVGGSLMRAQPRYIKDYVIPLPPLHEQRRIASRIEWLFAKLDDAEAELREVIDGSEQRQAAILHKAFSGQLTEPWRREHGISQETWTEKTLGDVCSSIFDGDHMPPPKAANGIPFLVISNVNDGHLSFEDTRFVPEDYYNNLTATRKPEIGDVLYTLVGSYGIPVMVDDERPFCFQRHMALLKPSDIEQKYLWYLLRSQRMFEKATAIATGTAQLTVPIKGLRNLEFNCPSSEERAEIIRQLDILLLKEEQALSTVRSVLEITTLTRQAILAKALRGELGTNDPGEASSKELLASIMSGNAGK
ncbi:MAG: restriction endonuclease subunit S [Atopobiaceae bacterium]|nr:restriction endonuclease subunit S [Atopobiaceae bacterium]